MSKYYISFFFFVFSVRASFCNCSDLPLYAGTLLAENSANIPPGQLYLASYFYFSFQNGIYNTQGNFVKQSPRRFVSTTTFLETGITSFLDIAINLGANYSQTRHFQTTTYQDMQATLGFQILTDTSGCWIPDLRILIGEYFPTGSYQNLDPDKHYIDSSGLGTYQTVLTLVAQKIFCIFPMCPFELNINLQYATSTRTKIKGSSIYGSPPSTQGIIKPGDAYLMNFSFAFGLSKYFVLGADIHYTYRKKSHFSGTPLSYTKAPPSSQFSLAPGLEYNFNRNLSITTGVWFSLFGKNNAQFVTPMVGISATF